MVGMLAALRCDTIEGVKMVGVVLSRFDGCLGLGRRDFGGDGDRDREVILTSFAQLLLLPFPTTWINALLLPCARDDVPEIAYY